MNVFLDSSALAKRYVQEPGSDRLEEILSLASSLGVSAICVSEVVSALCRRRREKKLSKQEYVKAKRALFEDIEDASVVNVTDQVVARAVELLELWPLRCSDALHIASAAEWSAELFVSADEKQCLPALRAEAISHRQTVSPCERIASRSAEAAVGFAYGRFHIARFFQLGRAGLTTSSQAVGQLGACLTDSGRITPLGESRVARSSIFQKSCGQF